MRWICLIIILLTLLAHSAKAEDDTSYLVVAMTENLYTNPTVRLKGYQAYEWWTQDAARTNEFWEEKEWSGGFMYGANTNITIYVYCESFRNIQKDQWNGARTLPDVLTNLVAKIKSNPQIEAGPTTRPLALLKKWNVYKKPPIDEEED